ncbi:hypothetical protein JOC34_004008 [Virgibacillus halotolerans]|uniref:YolD-like family protein n=1 Tax=Virgibacillus halotolerans TaxID=1071053 RepID=UPI0019603D35|nr:YolD-like family protein [Virgibacillus halotolerans]MBM7601580.1 hypothetical protein [Virgibacillus halotolerans]
MVNDRGTRKWTSMMLPEHNQMLEALWKEDEKKIKPILDEQQKIEIDRILQLALMDGLTVEITYFMDHNYHTIKGKLLRFDPLKNDLKLDSEENDIYLHDIINITIL